MKRLVMLIFLCSCLGGAALAQQSATVAGTIAAPEAIPDNARVGVHVVDRDGVWGREVGTGTPQGEAFSVELSGAAEPLTPFRSDDVVLPGLQNNYSLSPEVDFTRAQVNVYIDEDGNGAFDRTTDTPYLGLAGTESPTGFFVPIYVSADTTLEAAGAALEFKAGWNIFSVSFPEGDDPVYAVSSGLDNARLDVFPSAP